MSLASSFVVAVKKPQETNRNRINTTGLVSIAGILGGCVCILGVHTFRCLLFLLRIEKSVHEPLPV